MSYTTPYAAKESISALYAKMLAETPNKAICEPIFERVKSNAKEENYLLFGNFWQITEWTASPTWSNYYNKDYSYTIVNKDWITGQVAIKKSDMKAEKYVLGSDAEIAIRNAVQKFINFPDKLIADLVDANANAFDGTPFFSNSRTNIEGSTAIDNIYTGSGTTLAQVYADFKGAMNQLIGLVDVGGTPFNISFNFIVMCPPQLFDKFNTLRVADTLYLSGTQSNDLKGLFDIIVNPYLGASDNDWYLINKNTPIKPFIVQEMIPPEWELEDTKSNPYYYYFATATGNAGYGNPMSIILVSNTGY